MRPRFDFLVMVDARLSENDGSAVAGLLEAMLEQRRQRRPFERLGAACRAAPFLAASAGQALAGWQRALARHAWAGGCRDLAGLPPGTPAGGPGSDHSHRGAALLPAGRAAAGRPDRSCRRARAAALVLPAAAPASRERRRSAVLAQAAGTSHYSGLLAAGSGNRRGRQQLSGSRAAANRACPAAAQSARHRAGQGAGADGFAPTASALAT